MIASSVRNLARMASEAPWRSLPRSAASAFHSGNVKNMSPHLRTKLPPLINTANGPMGTYLKTATDISKGQTVLSCTGELVARPTIHTVQISEKLHMDNAGRIKYTSHSCDPNSKMEPKKTGCKLIAIKDISAGETLSFDYETTEWDMSAPFDCLCGASNCKKVIKGYKHLSDETRSAMDVDNLSDYVKEMHALHSKRQG